jgi:hypothetical protein
VSHIQSGIASIERTVPAVIFVTAARPSPVIGAL